MAKPGGANLKFRDASRDWVIQDIRRAAESSRAIRGILIKLEADLVRKLNLYSELKLTGESAQQLRMEALLRDVRASVEKTSEEGYSVQRLDLNEIFTSRMANSTKDLNKAIGFDLFRVSLNPGELEAFTKNAHVAALGNANLGEWWDTFSTKTQGRIASQIQLGYLEGETTPQLAARLLGVPTGQKLPVVIDGKVVLVPEYQGGAMQGSRNEAMTLARTMAHGASNAALVSLYEDNEDVVKGFEAIATLDNRTSDFCIARDGARWNLDGALLKDSPVTAEYPGYPPPWHPNCRTTLAPITYSWEELVEQATGEKKEILDTVPDATRASMDGQVPGRETWEDFLERKGDSWAEDKLGEERFRLWKNGKVTFSQLMDGASQPTVKERKVLKEMNTASKTLAQLAETERDKEIAGLETRVEQAKAEARNEMDDEVLALINEQIARLEHLIDIAPTAILQEDEEEA